MATSLREEDALAHIHGVCFKTGPPGRVGAELEWLVHDRADPRLAVSTQRLDAAVAGLQAPDAFPNGSRLTREPGGQIELSSPPATSLAECVRMMDVDGATLRRALDASGLLVVGSGLDPHREPPRISRHPRYRAMEAYFDRGGPWGRMMMGATAAIQINLDAGDDTPGASGYRHRWTLAHRLGPVLVAAFANSPVWRGRATGWVSTRQAVWARIDPARTRAPRHDDDPRTSWADYALHAPLLCVRRSPPADWSAPHGLTFQQWLKGAPGLPPPTLDDLDYHLTTLFPPVRPRGWLELRMIDAQAGGNWIVPVALATMLLDDPIAADAAFAATASLCRDRSAVPPPEVWSRAARLGPSEPELGAAVIACFAAAEGALARAGAPDSLRRAVSEFADRYPSRGRCPAHDQLDALRDGVASDLLEGAS